MAALHSNGVLTNDDGRMTNDEFKNEPLSDFSVEANRNAMTQALRAVRAQLGRTYTVVIDNAPVTSTEFVDSFNPSTPSPW